MSDVFVCGACGEEKPCPAIVWAETIDEKVVLFCNEDCAKSWLKKVLEDGCNAALDELEAGGARRNEDDDDSDSPGPHAPVATYAPPESETGLDGPMTPRMPLSKLDIN